MHKPSIKNIAVALRPEAQLLICCARTLMDSANAERVRALVKGDIDWLYLASLALEHRLAPLLYWNLNTTCPDSVPPNALAELRSHFHTNAQYNLYLTRELVKLLECFEAHNIPAIPFKGPVLAATIYGNLAFRQFGDLDILVHPQDVSRARDLLISQGYELLPLSTLYEYHYHLVHQNGRPKRVELHWRATMQHFTVPLDLGYFWDRLESLSLAGMTVRCFPVEEMLLILCLHGAKHHWSRLSWICDVAELLRLPQTLDWERIIAQVNRLDCERIFLLGLFLANDLLASPLPPAIRSRVQADPIVKSLAAQVGEWLFFEDDIPYKRLEQYDFYLRTEGHWRARLAYWLYLVHQKVSPNVRDQTFLPLPASLSFLYYLLRPIRLVRDYGSGRDRLTYLLNATTQDFRDAW